jgi:hypothetical protein
MDGWMHGWMDGWIDECKEGNRDDYPLPAE